ncbi:MAG: pilus assembly protein MshD [Pseudomonadota bacterium]
MEVILFILVVSLALVVTMQAFNLANTHSADPLLRRQSLAIAQSLLEEILAKPFGSAATDNPAEGGFAGPYTAANRHLFDDVDDYHGFAMSGIHTLDNVAVTGLGQYSAAVTVSEALFGGVPSTAGRRITITVTDPAGNQVTLDGYRADY